MVGILKDNTKAERQMSNFENDLSRAEGIIIPYISKPETDLLIVKKTKDPVIH